MKDEDRDALFVAEAKEIAERILASWKDGVGEDPPEVTDQDRLALGFAVLFRRLLEPETRPLLSRCGWCVAAVGDDDAAWQSAEDFDLAGIVSERPTVCKPGEVVRWEWTDENGPQNWEVAL